MNTNQILQKGFPEGYALVIREIILKGKLTREELYAILGQDKKDRLNRIVYNLVQGKNLYSFEEDGTKKLRVTEDGRKFLETHSHALEKLQKIN